jgi:hypothetical protein
VSRWIWVTVSTGVTSCIGIAINLATELRTNVWAWLAVAVLTAVAGMVSYKLTQPESSQQEPASKAITGERNLAATVEAKRDGHVQQATGYGRARIQQAGGDIVNKGKKNVK